MTVTNPSPSHLVVSSRLSDKESFDMMTKSIESVFDRVNERNDQAYVNDEGMDVDYDATILFLSKKKQQVEAKRRRSTILQ